MKLEMQVESDKLLALLRQRFLQQRICITDPITSEYYLDHLIISDETHFDRVQLDDIVVYSTHHVQGYKLQLVQPLSIFLVTLEQLQAANDQPAKYQQCDLNVIFDVFMSRDKDGWALHVDFSDVVSVNCPVSDSAKQKIKENLAGQTKPTPIDISPLKKLTGEDFVVAESFIGCDSGMARIAIRFEKQTAGPLEGASAWEQFLIGNIGQSVV